MSRYLLILPLLAACGGGPAAGVQGRVLDQWGDPIEGVTVAIDGSKDRPLTDADGLFQVTPGDGELKLKAGKNGYIQDHMTVAVTKDTTLEELTFKLWSQPEETGFYMVGTAGYHKLDPVGVEIFGSGSSTVQGIENVGQARAEGELKVLFHTDLREHEIEKFDLELHGLEFVKTATVNSVQGPAEVKVNLYKSTGAVTLDRESLHSKNDYLLTSPELPAGYYAFNSMHLLDMADSEKFDQIPKDLRIAFPFELTE